MINSRLVVLHAQIYKQLNSVSLACQSFEFLVIRIATIYNNN